MTDKLILRNEMDVAKKLKARVAELEARPEVPAEICEALTFTRDATVHQVVAAIKGLLKPCPPLCQGRRSALEWRGIDMKIVKVKKGQSFASLLRNIRASKEAQQWVGKKSLRTVYRTCERPDLLLWLAGKLGIGRRVLVLIACECARLALVHVPMGEDRPRIAIETAETWALGDPAVTLNMVRYAAYAAASAAYAAADAAARAQCCEIVRRRITIEMFQAAIGRRREKNGKDSK